MGENQVPKRTNKLKKRLKSKKQKNKLSQLEARNLLLKLNKQLPAQLNKHPLNRPKLQKRTQKKLTLNTGNYLIYNRIKYYFIKHLIVNLNLNVALHDQCILAMLIN